MRDEVKTWWLFSGNDVEYDLFFFFKKIRVTLESRTVIWVAFLLTITVKNVTPNNHRWSPNVYANYIIFILFSFL